MDEKNTQKLIAINVTTINPKIKADLKRYASSGKSSFCTCSEERLLTGKLLTTRKTKTGSKTASTTISLGFEEPFLSKHIKKPMKLANRIAKVPGPTPAISPS